MKTKNKQIQLVLLNLFLASTLSVFWGCKKENKDEEPQPNYCSDGIQNSGETGVDCGGTCIPCGNAINFSKNYYLQFKENGGSAYTYFQADQPQYMQSGTSIVEAQTEFSLGFNSTHAFVLRYSGSPTLLAGKTVSFNYGSAPSAKMIFFDSNGNVDRSSSNVTDQAESNCHIESVTLLETNPVVGTKKEYVYSVKGNFNCKVAKSNGSGSSMLSYGKFSLRVVEIK